MFEPLKKAVTDFLNPPEVNYIVHPNGKREKISPSDEIIDTNDQTPFTYSKDAQVEVVRERKVIGTMPGVVSGLVTPTGQGSEAVECSLGAIVLPSKDEDLTGKSIVDLV